MKGTISSHGGLHTLCPRDSQRHIKESKAKGKVILCAQEKSRDWRFLVMYSRSTFSNQKPDVSDDETLARILQFEEQSSARISDHEQYLTKQELDDLKLAREYARLDLEVAQSEKSNEIESHQDYEQSSSSEHRDNFRNNAMLNDTNTRRSLSIKDQDDESIRSQNEGTTSHRHSQSMLDPMEYAKCLQQEAFLKLEQKNQRPELVSTHNSQGHDSLDNRGFTRRLTERSMFDLQVQPLRHQDQVNTMVQDVCTRKDQEWLDERLARYLEMTGRSLRSLKEAEVNKILKNLSSTDQVLSHRPRSLSPPSSSTNQVQATETKPILFAEEVLVSRYPNESPSPKACDASRGRLNSSSIRKTSSNPSSPICSRHEILQTMNSRSAATSPQQLSISSMHMDPAFFPSRAPLSSPLLNKDKRRKLRTLLGFGRKDPKDAMTSSALAASNMSIPSGIPSSIPPPPGGSLSVPPPKAGIQNINHTTNRNSTVCASCHKSGGRFIAALGNTYHQECFRCGTCNYQIEPSTPFAFVLDNRDERVPHHCDCLPTVYSVQCTVCMDMIPATQDGIVPYVRHPFFDSEHMCICHVEDHSIRRCSGCHRFEPKSLSFVDLHDKGRCICHACCRTAVMDSIEAQRLWNKVLNFMSTLGLPIWDDMYNIPALIVGIDALTDKLCQNQSAHFKSSHITTRGLCLTAHEHDTLVLPSLRFNHSSQSFESTEEHPSGFTFFDLSPSRNNTNSTVVAVLCLSGLPLDLTASVLAHEATHAWIKLHPKYNVHTPLPLQVEEGCAQLMAKLLLDDGLEPTTPSAHGADGPSDEKLRQYFRFSIETEESEIYGAGYRKAAVIYRAIGMDALLSHAVQYREFPQI